MKRTISIAAALAGLVVLVPTAAASDTSETTTAPPSGTATTVVPTTSPPAAEVPVTTTATTSTPTTSTPTTSTPTTSTPTTSTPTTTTTTTVPTTGTEVPCTVDCVPVDTPGPCVGADCIPSGGASGIPTAGGAYPGTIGAGTLPFTGIEDMIAPILLALTVVLGGVVAWRWARLRESVAEAASRARPIATREVRTGYAVAARSFGIEQRARQVFTPRVA